MQILYQKVGLTPNGGPGSVAGLSTSVCVCVCVASGSTGQSAKGAESLRSLEESPKAHWLPSAGPSK